MKNKNLIFALLIGSGSAVYAATGNLTVFDDADENAFNHAAAICTNNAFFNITSPVHSGSMAVGVSKNFDNDGAGWAAPAVYSAQSDYDGVTFWVNAGSNATTLTSLAIYDVDSNPHFAHLEDDYGGPLPANTWIQFQIPFSSPLFASADSSSPTTIQTICVINHSSGAGSQFLYLDDVALTGADIFKNGFE